MQEDDKTIEGTNSCKTVNLSLGELRLIRIIFSLDFTQSSMFRDITPWQLNISLSTSGETANDYHFRFISKCIKIIFLSYNCIIFSILIALVEKHLGRSE